MSTAGEVTMVALHVDREVLNDRMERLPPQRQAMVVAKRLGIAPAALVEWKPGIHQLFCV